MVNTPKTVKNSVSFKVGDQILNESFIDEFQACYFIEQSPFEIIAATLNGEWKTGEDSNTLCSYVKPTEYLTSLKQSIPTMIQEILGMIAWYQDKLDMERNRAGEETCATEKVYTMGQDF